MHRPKLTYSLPLACILLLAGCGGQGQLSETERDALVERSGEIARELQMALGKRLKAALQEGGPVAGIEVCKDMAQPLTKEVAAGFKAATVSRTALRYRNPANAPDPRSTAVLRSWERQLGREGTVLEPQVDGAEGTVIVHRPILTAPLCLQCHGDPESFPPDLQQALSEAYPNDKAVGFAAGDLRGAFRIVFRGAESPSQ